MDNNIGTSLILLNSLKGVSYFEKTKKLLEYKETSFDTILTGNVALYKPLDLPQIDRKCFFYDLDKNGFDFVVQKYFPLNNNSKKNQSLKIRIKKK